MLPRIKKTAAIKDLDQIADRYSEETGFERKLTEFKTREITKFCKGEKVLDLGCGVGLVTKELVRVFDQVVGVDGSLIKIERARKLYRDSKIKFIYSLFEEYCPKQNFDKIVASNVLEHIEKPVVFLKKIRSWLSRRGVIIITVPNALSLHKKIGKVMGLVSNLYHLTDEDIKKGHKRIYDKKILTDHFEKAGLKVKYLGGIFLKPLSSAQLESWDEKIVEALYQVGKELPDWCSSLIIVGEKR